VKEKSRMASPSVTSAQSRSPTRRDPLARYRPRSFGEQSRWRFRRDRQALYLSQVRGAPTSQQKALIESLISLEFNALKAEASDDAMVTYREARQLRIEFVRVLSAFEKTLLVKPAESGPSLVRGLADMADAANRGGRAA
jgi:hypothetical protein